MRTHMNLIGVVVAALSVSVAGAQDIPSPVLPICPGGVSLREDPAIPGTVLATFEDLPVSDPATCAPFDETIEWYVTWCADYVTRCDTYVSRLPRRWHQTMAFRPKRVGLHMVFATWPGAPAHLQPIRAIYRKY